MSLIHANPNECQECGMMCGDYHPYAACLMYKACGDVETVTQNLEQVQRHRTKDLEQQLVRQEAYYMGDRKRIADLEQQLAELQARIADYEYPLRENNWVKVRQEVWDGREQQLEDLRKDLKTERSNFAQHLKNTKQLRLDMLSVEKDSRDLRDAAQVVVGARNGKHTNLAERIDGEKAMFYAMDRIEALLNNDKERVGE